MITAKHKQMDDLYDEKQEVKALIDESDALNHSIEQLYQHLGERIIVAIWLVVWNSSAMNFILRNDVQRKRYTSSNSKFNMTFVKRKKR
ncbi:conserved cytoplasmic protein [Staphylococcus aureus]|nr:conserved cytoplasmic protein [Staphylococcus aureus]